MSFAKKNWMPLLLFKGEKDKHNAYRLARWDTNKSSTKFQKKKKAPKPCLCLPAAPGGRTVGKIHGRPPLQQTKYEVLL
jgi:hypothetical protein